MRIQLKHTSECQTAPKVKKHLEKIIAEEGLPLAVEANQCEKNEEATVVKILGSGFEGQENVVHEINCESHHEEELQFLDNLRRIVLAKWHDHAVLPLSQVHET
ncbi:MAG: hypothetical protein K2X27_18640 [Candidatus Obscuribacterales bacterium]|nr:hypothetical protein [Candidatus Obscuribacterales bacterium]